jgi:hypothetical protein
LRVKCFPDTSTATYKAIDNKFKLLELHALVSELFDPAKVNNNQAQQREAKRQYKMCCT